MRTVVVTGAGGFLGSQLCRLLADKWRVIGAGHGAATKPHDTEWVAVDEDEGLARCVADYEPDLVIHAAFLNRKPSQWTDSHYLRRMIAVNLPLYRAVAACRSNLLLVSSSAVYAPAREDEIIDEEFPLRPVSVYGIAKLFQESLAHYEAASGLNLCTVRLFNLMGPGQKPGLVLPDWVAQAWAVVRGEAAEVRIRHRNSRRDFLDVRDAATALELLADDFRSGEIFNVCSGRAVSLQDISEELARLSPVPLHFVETEPLQAAADVPVQRGSYAKIEASHGWHPEVEWQQSLADLWRAYENV